MKSAGQQIDDIFKARRSRTRGSSLTLARQNLTITVHLSQPPRRFLFVLTIDEKIIDNNATAAGANAETEFSYRQRLHN